MKQYIVDLQSFRVEASTEIEAWSIAEQMIKAGTAVLKVEVVEEVD
jgi:hypothetical protein